MQYKQQTIKLISWWDRNSLKYKTIIRTVKHITSSEVGVVTGKVKVKGKVVNVLKCGDCWYLSEV